MGLLGPLSSYNSIPLSSYNSIPLVNDNDLDQEVELPAYTLNTPPASPQSPSTLARTVPLNDVNTLDEEQAQPPAYVLTSSQTSITPPHFPSSALTLPLTSSPLPYHPSLSSFAIGPAEWNLLTQDLQRATTSTATQKSLAVLSGVGAALVTGEPVSSFFIGRYVLKRQVVCAVRKGLEGEHEQQEARHEAARDGERTDGESESVRGVLKRWNEVFWGRGVVIGLEVLEKKKKEKSCGEKKKTGCCKANKSSCADKKQARRESSNEKKETKCCGARSRAYFQLTVTKDVTSPFQNNRTIEFGASEIGANETVDEKHEPAGW